jgi:hypothetical protein
VDDPGTGIHDLGDLGSELAEIGGKDRRGDADTLKGIGHGSFDGTGLVSHPVSWGRGQIGWSIEEPQLWQLMSSVVLILAIVWCSPQFGHCDTSS